MKRIFILAGNLKRKLFNGPQRSKLNEEGACGAVSRRQFHVGRCLALGAIQLISAIYGRKYQGNTGATVAAARGGGAPDVKTWNMQTKLPTIYPAGVGRCVTQPAPQPGRHLIQMIFVQVEPVKTALSSFNDGRSVPMLIVRCQRFCNERKRCLY